MILPSFYLSFVFFLLLLPKPKSPSNNSKTSPSDINTATTIVIIIKQPKLPNDIELNTLNFSSNMPNTAM